MANINIRINEDLKKQAESVFKSLGMTPTTAINLFYTQVVRTCSIPFELKADIPNKETIQALKEVDQIDKGKAKSKTYNDVDELMSDLLK